MRFETQSGLRSGLVYARVHTCTEYDATMGLIVIGMNQATEHLAWLAGGFIKN